MIKVDYKRLNNPEFLSVARKIASSMDGNATFATLQQRVDEVSPDIEEYARLLVKSLDGSKIVIAARNAIRKVVTDKLILLGTGVAAICREDRAKLESSGFLLCKHKRTTPPFVKPVAPRLKPGVNGGEILCRAKKQKGCTGVSFFITATPEAKDSWQQESTSRSKWLFQGLQSGVTYYIKYRLIGTKGKEAWSDISFYIPQ